jgi:hypothetical protein
MNEYIKMIIYFSIAGTNMNLSKKLWNQQLKFNLVVESATWRWAEQLCENIRKNEVQSAHSEIKMDGFVGSKSSGQNK